MVAVVRAPRTEVAAGQRLGALLTAQVVHADDEARPLEQLHSAEAGRGDDFAVLPLRV